MTPSFARLMDQIVVDVAVAVCHGVALLLSFDSANAVIVEYCRIRERHRC